MNIKSFITLIKERPVLYDVRNPLFKNRREKDKKFMEICTALHIPSKYLQKKDISFYSFVNQVVYCKNDIYIFGYKI